MCKCVNVYTCLQICMFVYVHVSYMCASVCVCVYVCVSVDKRRVKIKRCHSTFMNRFHVGGPLPLSTHHTYTGGGGGGGT